MTKEKEKEKKTEGLKDARVGDTKREKKGWRLGGE